MRTSTLQAATTIAGAIQYPGLVQVAALPTSQRACDPQKYDPDLWYSDSIPDQRLAITICNGCPVKAQCLIDANERSEPYGVFGALTARERRLTLGLEELEEDNDNDLDAMEPADRERRHTLWRRGLTDLQIAGAQGVSHNSVQKWRVRQGLPPNGTQGRRSVDAAAERKRRDMWELGMSDGAIAAQLGMRKQAITQWRNRAKLPCHRLLEAV